MRWFATLVGILLLVALIAFGLAWRKTEQGLAAIYVVNDPPLSMSHDPVTLAQGEHFFKTRGCADCHGADGAGKLVLDAGPVIRLVAPNITPAGKTKGWSADQIGAAIRHGVKSDGHPMIFMPTGDFHGMSDDDTASLVAYIQSLPASNNDPGPTQIRPLGRVLYWLGKFPLLPAEHIDHTPRRRDAPTLAATADYGQYLAQGCTGCHGQNFAGQHVPGTPPEFPNATNLTLSGPLKTWQAEDFQRALRTGKRPDGSVLNELMPWRSFSQLSDIEIAALWAYLHGLPPVANNEN